MPSSRPVATDLLDVVRDYLSKEIAPQLPDYHRFQLRIADRLLEIVSRELRHAGAFDGEEAQRLAALLGRDGAITDLNAELCARIRDGRIAIDDPALLAHLRRTTEDALRINTPKWLQRPEDRAAG